MEAASSSPRKPNGWRCEVKDRSFASSPMRAGRTDFAEERSVDIENIDDIDRRIIAILEQDGRRPYTAIAREVGVSEGTARVRVAALQDRGILRIVALCAPTTVGLQGVRLLISVRRLSPRSVARSLAELPATNHVSLVSGTHDIYIEATCRDIDQAVEFLDQVRRVPGVDRVDQQIVRTMYRNDTPLPAEVAGQGRSGSNPSQR
jgi:Lrp/AsnC family transcriptional regulator for asnA, asnC and gidA